MIKAGSSNSCSTVFSKFSKTRITAADLFNDQVLPFYQRHGLPVLRIILADRGTEYCGKADLHDFQCYLTLNDIDHTNTKAKSLQAKGICERFRKTFTDEF